MISSFLHRSSLVSASRFFVQRKAASVLIQKFEESVNKLPMREAIRYKSIKNGKWTALDLKVLIYY